jgi:hypothetical protein
VVSTWTRSGGDRRTVSGPADAQDADGAGKTRQTCSGVERSESADGEEGRRDRWGQRVGEGAGDVEDTEVLRRGAAVREDVDDERQSTAT